MIRSGTKKLNKSLHRIPKKWLEIGGFVLILAIFVIKSASYLQFEALTPSNIISFAQNSYSSSKEQIGQLKYFGKCPNNMIKVNIDQQYLCRASVEPSVYQKMYDTYPRNPDGKELIYSVLDKGSVDTADKFIHDQYVVPRFDTATLKQPLTWTEDPYNDKYWRFNFYSLRIFKDLLYAADETGDAKYTDKMISILNSYLDTGIDQPHSWDDYHAVAWRSMVLTNTWWNLRENNVLPVETSNKMLAAIERHADFLAEPGHYESQFNHGTNEAAALYLMGTSFPDLPNSDNWLETGKQRLAGTLNDLIDKNGALVEHSPYYHFYVLEKYWEIDRYSKAQNTQISPEFDQKIKDMIHYATYILQPDLHVPIIGASLDRQIHNSDEFAEMTDVDPEFKYVMTRGAEGKKPSNNIQFAETGQSIMRSGWNPKNYTQQTQVIFNYGAYSTQHSHLDTLSLELYGGGIPLLPGPGLYSYKKGPFYDYFTGTSASNTVMVDKKNQQPGTGFVGQYVDKGDYVSQSASEQLNQGVTHERQVTLIGNKTVVVIDKLHSDEKHTYQQLFHLFPGAEYSHDGLTVNAKGQKDQQNLEIHQLITDGVELSDVYNDQDPSHLGGICSVQYEKIIPCRQITYTKNDKNATFITVLKIGKPDNSSEYKVINDKVVQVKVAGKTYTINIGETSGKNTSVMPSDIKTVAPEETQIVDTNNTDNWETTNGRLETTSDTFSPGQNTALLTSEPNQLAWAKKSVSLDLSKKNTLIRIKVPQTQNIKDLDFILFSNGSSYAQNRIMNSYQSVHDNEWLTISLGKGMSRTQQGQWGIYGDDFDWSSIKAVAFRVGSKDGTAASLYFGPVSTYEEQNEGKVAMVFDDAYLSIKPAADALDKYNYKASVGVIGMYPSRKQSGYLSISDLRKFKNNKWSIVNHSYFHKDAVAEYYNKNGLGSYEKDILMGAAFLSENDLTTDENWYIDPHGTSNTATENIAGKYYKFVRTTLQAPEVYPFGDSKVVKTFGVQNDTPVEEVKNAIDDANKYHLTLFLTFHRIYSTPTDRPGYDINKFKEIVEYLHSTQSNVMSLNQLDESNGVTLNHLKIEEGYPAQLTTKVTVTKPSIVEQILN